MFIRIFLVKVDESSKEARIFLMQKRMEVLFGDGEDTDLMKMLDILDISSSDGVSASLEEQQQIKNVRANSAILRQLHELPIDEERKSNFYVLAMD